ncbi:uncharacterized protein LODBEIA_P51770 [Lodderomyces beijingensis]|uniref:Uncharacterized protein n=1 Tax=Lodderomyces beijingensis TaxID=1775926 RepID=A0ABP0ZTF4_9ASCO
MNSTLTHRFEDIFGVPIDDTTVVGLIIASVISVYVLTSRLKSPSSAKQPRQSTTTTAKTSSSFYDKSTTPKKMELTPLTDFEWDKADAIKSMPFKNAPYKLTMGIKNLDPQDWLLIEPTYKSRIETKVKIINNKHPDYPVTKDLRSSTIFATPEASAAIVEFYDTVMSYMSAKYPTCFHLDSASNQIHNMITSKSYPARGTGVDPTRLEEYLAETIEEDFIILLKDPTRNHEEDGTEYFFKAGVFAFAAGFNPGDRFNKPLSFIHHPIPNYTAKLKTSMNRFFNRISPGQFVTRSNWSMQTHAKLYVDDENKGHNLPRGHVQRATPFEEMDFKAMHYRSERQVLTKLERSQAVVFTIHTYLVPLSQVREEGKEVCQRLIGAIRGFPPEISQYKRADEWGPAVMQYLSQNPESFS